MLLSRNAVTPVAWCVAVVKRMMKKKKNLELEMLPNNG